MIISPCINKCKLHDNICIGCKRTIDEIIHWREYTDNKRKKIINELKNR